MKLQPLVSDFYLCNERMIDVYRLLLERGKILAVHAGTAPVANRFVGAEYFEPVLRELPELKVVVAHMGAFEFDRFFRMVRDYPNVYLDTSVNFIDPSLIAALVSEGKFPPLEVPASFDPEVLLELSDRLLFGSDFPNIPYTYGVQQEGLLREREEADRLGAMSARLTRCHLIQFLTSNYATPNQAGACCYRRFIAVPIQV
jgi:hypothetical protein